MRRLRWLPLLAVLGLAVQGCATMNVSSHVDRERDFTQYRTWQWAKADPLPASSPEVDGPYFRDYFQGAVENEFRRRGVTQTFPDAGQPDLLVHYHATIGPQIAPVDGDGTGGACYDADCLVRVVETDVDTIVLDVMDARTNTLVWRGWVQNATAGALNNPGRLQSRIREAVARMFVRFPRSS